MSGILNNSVSPLETVPPPPPGVLDADGVQRATGNGYEVFNINAKAVDLSNVDQSQVLQVLALDSLPGVFPGLPDNGISLEGGSKFDFLNIGKLMNSGADVRVSGDGTVHIGTVVVHGFEAIQVGFGENAETYVSLTDQDALDALNLHKVLGGDADFSLTAGRIMRADGDVGAVFGEAFAGLTEQQAVEKLYDALGRSAGSSELAFWANEMAKTDDDMSVVHRFFGAAAENGEAPKLGDVVILRAEPKPLPEGPAMEPASGSGHSSDPVVTHVTTYVIDGDVSYAWAYSDDHDAAPAKGVYKNPYPAGGCTSYPLPEKAVADATETSAPVDFTGQPEPACRGFPLPELKVLPAIVGSDASVPDYLAA